MTARLRVVRLPGGGPFHALFQAKPFMVVVDRAADLMYAAQDADESGQGRHPWEGLTAQLGARAVLVTECDLDIPQVDGEDYIDAEVIEAGAVE